MELNRKLFKGGIIIIIIILVFSLGISLYLKLDKPIFLKSYMEIDLPINNNGKVEFELRYITNINDDRVVNNIEFEEVPGIFVNASEFNSGSLNFFGNQNNSMPGQVEGRYSIRSIYIWVEGFGIENPLDEMHITKAKIHFNNGDSMEAEIGDIVLYGYNNTNEHFEYQSGSSSSDGTTNNQLQVKKDITLLGIESSLLQQTKDFIEIKIGNVDYDKISGIKYSQGDKLRIDTLFKTPEDPILKFYNYNIHPNLIYKDNEGNIFTHRVYNVDYRNYNFEFKEIVKFLRARGEI